MASFRFSLHKINVTKVSLYKYLYIVFPIACYLLFALCGNSCVYIYMAMPVGGRLGQRRRTVSSNKFPITFAPISNCNFNFLYLHTLYICTAYIYMPYLYVFIYIFDLFCCHKCWQAPEQLIAKWPMERALQCKLNVTVEMWQQFND